MPYIDTSKRPQLDKLIDEIVEKICLDHPNKRAGLCNYVITRILLNSLKPLDGWNYNSLNSVHGVLDCASKEIYAKLTRPYEYKAAASNGDLEEFKQNEEELNKKGFEIKSVILE